MKSRMKLGGLGVALFVFAVGCGGESDDADSLLGSLENDVAICELKANAGPTGECARVTTQSRRSLVGRSVTQLPPSEGGNITQLPPQEGTDVTQLPPSDGGDVARRRR